MIAMNAPARVFCCLVIYAFVSFSSIVDAKSTNDCRRPKKSSKGDKDACALPFGKKSPKSPGGIPKRPILYSYEILDTIKRDGDIFTQGMEIWKPCRSCRESIFSSSGLYGESYLVEVDLKTRETVQEKSLPDDEFGEGLTIIDNKLYQLVWNTNKVYVYDVENFQNVKTKEHAATDGWGLANNGTHLIISDGTEILTFVEPQKTERAVKHLLVTFNGTGVTNMNELEWIDGVIYANIWKSDCIAKIDPSNGKVFGWIDASNLREIVKVATKDIEDNQNFGYTLNGLAVRPGKTSPLYVTGKRWPTIFLIEEKPMNGGRAMSDKDIQRMKKKCLIDV